MTKTVIYFIIKKWNPEHLDKCYITDQKTIDEETGATLYRYDYNPIYATDFGSRENAKQWMKENGFGDDVNKIETIIFNTDNQ